MFFWSSKPELPNDAVGVPIFSRTHLEWLSVVLIICVFMVLFFHKAKPFARKKILNRLSWIMLLAILGRLILLLFSGTLSLAWDLPLHLCDVMVFVEFYTLRSHRVLLKECCWCLGMPGAFSALLTPGETAFPMWNIYYIIFILLHTILFLIPILLVVDGFRPNVRRLPKCFLFLLALAAMDTIFNAMFHGNYLFLRWGPAGSILETLQSAVGPWYIPAAMAGIWVLWGMIYGGWYLVNRLIHLKQH